MPEKIDLWPFLSVQSILNWTSNQNPSMFAAIWILKRWLHGRLTSVCAIYLERGTNRGASGTRFTSWPRASLWPSSCHGPSYSLLHQVCPWWYAPVDSSSPPATEEEVSSTLLRDVLCPKYAYFFASRNSLLAAFLVVIHFSIIFSNIRKNCFPKTPPSIQRWWPLPTGCPGSKGLKILVGHHYRKLQWRYFFIYAHWTFIMRIRSILSHKYVLV